MRDGDLVQFDYAPDYKYYQSDVTRVFPANGRFTPRQREFYTIYLQLYQALMTSITVHATPRRVMKDAVAKMDAIMASFPFTDPKIKDAAPQFVETLPRRARRRAASGTPSAWKCTTSAACRPTTLEPGRIFTIEPAMQIDAERLSDPARGHDPHHRTGYENLSAFVPIEIDDIERLMAQPGLSDAALNFPGH